MKLQHDIEMAIISHMRETKVQGGENIVHNVLTALANVFTDFANLSNNDNSIAFWTQMSQKVLNCTN